MVSCALGEGVVVKAQRLIHNKTESLGPKLFEDKIFGHSYSQAEWNSSKFIRTTFCFSGEHINNGTYAPIVMIPS